MAERTVKVVLQVKDDFSKPLQEYQRKVQSAADASKYMDDNTKKTSGALDGLNKAFKRFLGVWTAGKIIEKAGELNELGMKANIATSTFEALAGGADIAAARLEALRKVTGNTVSDLTLMQSSNKLLQMGLAQNTEDLARFTEIATKLGRAMGTDVNTSLENFALLLANNSYLRLDTFGISSAKVRERVKELKEEIEGLDTSTAFMQATLEEGEEALNRLGNAAEAGITPWAMLQTRIDNTVTSIGVFTAGVFDATGQMAVLGSMLLTGELSWSAYAAALQGATSEEIRRINELSKMRPGDIIVHPQGQFDPNNPANSLLQGNQSLNDTIARRREELAVLQEVAEVQQRNAEAEKEAWAERVRQRRDYLDAHQIFGDAAQLGFRLHDSPFSIENFLKLRTANEEMDKLASKVERLHAEGLVTEEELGYFRAMSDQTGRWVEDAQAIGERLGAQDIQNFQKLFGGAGKLFSENMRNLAGIDIISPDAANQIDQYRDRAMDILKEVEELQKLGLVDQAEVENARGIAEEFNRMADDAERASTAINNMSLDQLLGRTSGGKLGEWTGSIIEVLKESGASDEQIAAYQQSFDLASGKETQFGIQFDEVLTPLVAELAKQVSPEFAAERAGAALGAIEQGRLAGLSDEQLLEVAQQAIGYKFGGEGQQFEVQPGDTATSVAARTGLSIDEVIAIASNTGTARGLQPGQYSAGPGLVSLNNAVVNPALNNQFFGLPPDANAMYGMNAMPGSAAAATGYGFTPLNPYGFSPQANAMTGGSLPVGAGLPTPFNTFGVFGEFGAGLGGAEGGPDAQGRADEDFAAMHEQLLDAKQAADELAASIGEVQHPIRDARDQTELFIQELDVLAAKSITVTVHAELLMDAQLKSLLAAVRGNGGRMPGADPRVPADPGGFGVS